jgi:hypothetical protein
MTLRACANASPLKRSKNKKEKKIAFEELAHARSVSICRRLSSSFLLFFARSVSTCTQQI